MNITAKVFKKNNVPEGVNGLVVGDYNIGELMANDKRIALVSATGSTRMGKKVGEAVPCVIKVTLKQEFYRNNQNVDWGVN